MSRSRQWNPSFLLPTESSQPVFVPRPPKFALFILNTPISISSKPLLVHLLDTSSLVYCVDGGGNRLIDAFGTSPNSPRPNLVIGDLDSLLPVSEQYFHSISVPVVRDPDQDSTDLGKAWKALLSQEKSENATDKYALVIFGGLSGRLDQTLSTISFLAWMEHADDREIWVVDPPNLACFMRRGKHTFMFPSREETNSFAPNPTIGLIPVQGETVLTTKGLKWNLNERKTKMGELVSSSNCLDDDNVDSRRVDINIEGENGILWNVELMLQEARVH
ncbi:thiamine pyrophosphokinase [Atractiella rhizophila]|nr:thiamine pyrophosphokinase [Atractiella rhizophila]